jgi:integrase
VAGKSKTVRFTAGRIDDFKCEEDKAQAFLWDSVSPGLGLRATKTGTRTYVFQARLNRETVRVTIGDPRTWDIPRAQAEARRLKLLVDSGKDPRKLKAEALQLEGAAREAEAAALEALRAKERREATTLGEVWSEYIADRVATREKGWSKHHINAHRKMIQEGGLARKRGRKLTTAGPLFSLAKVRLVDLTTERIESWAKDEAKKRPASARLAWRLLKAFMNWCAAHKAYSQLVAQNSPSSSRTRESLGKPKTRHDVLQREQLKPWFTAVLAIPNPVISAYLQCLLLVGPRREEMAELKWCDLDFQWGSMRLKDKVEAFRQVPLTPYVAALLSQLPRANQWVFCSAKSESGRIVEARIAHNGALTAAGLPHITLHGLRRSFATLSEWVEVPAGVSAQVQGHAPQGVREQNYIRRPLDLLRLWHVKIEAWILQQAGIEFSCGADL